MVDAAADKAAAKFLHVTAPGCCHSREFTLRATPQQEQAFQPSSVNLGARGAIAPEPANTLRLADRPCVIPAFGTDPDPPAGAQNLHQLQRLNL
ncbi:MAG: hypothetical protein ACREJ2_13300 [Planctomycetota bacterium]